ncbi:MAG: response regulator transcription factor [Gemmatimonadaceae bacterium]|jgi:two-component system copper resistance phosphate regulon response regulator CusR|nr:response regulator transcription factor [Gemmatimonadaceae bacterium]
MRVLLVEDDAALAELAAHYLRSSGFAVDRAPTGKMALALSATNPYDAVVLDLRLPDMDGLDVCRSLRSGIPRPRLLMATARDTVAERITGLDEGADDYLVKPYALAELVARLRAVLRRPSPVLDAALTVGDLELDTVSRIARRGGRVITLTTKEFAVLELFLRHPGAVLTREQISAHAWDDNYDPFSNVIDVYVARLRRKVDGAGEPSMLQTVRGAGYRLVAAEPATDA